ncbi:MAG: alpha/beta hydrolase [Actinomycetota bacterium]|nr:alpha/beta hydrolase [Actinomycetota bacterium]
MNRAHMRGAGALLAVALLAACSPAGGSGDAPVPHVFTGTESPGATPGQLQKFYQQRVEWSECGDDFECARVAVPLDYDSPGAGSIELSVVRRPASGDEKDRIGSLLLNPGGPGVSGVDYARHADVVVSEDLREHFDIVGFDPRGVARSEPIRCLTDRELDEFVAADGSPDDPGEERELLDQAAGLAKGCQARSGRLLAHVGTRNAARDLDVLRAVLGDESLHYLGKSYGTLLGATYAELFPARAGRLVLDGAVDPTVPNEQFGRAQAAGFEQAMRAFVADCLERDDCPFDGDMAAGLQEIAVLLERIDEHPLPSSGSERRLTQGLAVAAVAAALYDESQGWPILRTALGEAEQGEGTTLLRIADVYTDRQPDGRYSTNQNEAFYAVSCVDTPNGTADVDERRALAAEYAETAPLFGPYLAWGALPCASWPVPPEGKPGRIRAAGSPPILVVGTTRDPATPHVWAVGLVDQLDAGVLLSWDGDGHTAYRRGSSCVDEIVDTFLLRGETPEDGRRCE